VASLLYAALKAELSEVLADEAEIRFDEPMARHSTLRIGGPVDAWVAPRSYQAICRLRTFCHERQIPSRAFGAGSNLLVRDGGIRGVAISLRHLARIEVVKADSAKVAKEETQATDETHLFVEAGAATGKVLAFATLRELGGVEFLGGVPGSVGGGLIMNAGTYLGEFKDVTRRVFSVTAAGETVVRDSAECGFAYRHSTIPPDEVVTHARLTLRSRPRAEIDAEVRALRDRRRAREPHGVSNAGSTFKNPPGDYAGRLIETAGLKGRRVGAAEVSPVHANWLVNTGGATARDLLDLIAEVRTEVAKIHGVELELEVKVVGEEIE
jgi:UDP-N-acetylmuramate dehydrogenase